MVEDCRKKPTSEGYSDDAGPVGSLVVVDVPGGALSSSCRYIGLREVVCLCFVQCSDSQRAALGPMKG